MVEQSMQLDHIFQALADGTRRDILKRVSKAPHSISELAKPYDLSFAAIAKHVSVLERARLVSKERQGKEQLVIAVPATMRVAQVHIERYAKMWGDRFRALEALLQSK